MALTLSFQGELGAYSHQACLELYPDGDVLPCQTFESAILAVVDQRADLAILPIENSTYGRVADIHGLLPDAPLHVVGEHFLRVRINLLGNPGIELAALEEVISHPVLLGQCRRFLKAHQLRSQAVADTAGAAKSIAESQSQTKGALASSFAAQFYGLSVLAENVEDNADNTTRFLVMSATPSKTVPQKGAVMTSFVFRVDNTPAALYKAMGGFATNGVNMVKLESYMVGATFSQTQFYAETIGHPDDESMARALKELAFFTTHVRILGVFPVDPKRASDVVSEM